MKENKKDFMKLDDEVLEGVSGGNAQRVNVTCNCIYCYGVSHEMIKYSPVSVHVGTDIYRNAEKYLCRKSNRIFYVIEEDGLKWNVDDNMVMRPFIF